MNQLPKSRLCRNRSTSMTSPERYVKSLPNGSARCEIQIVYRSRERKAGVRKKLLVGAIGFEFSPKRSFNNMQVGGWHLRPRKAVLSKQTERKWSAVSDGRRC